MTAIANITVKKADNTTGIVWTGLKGSGGDNDPAVYRSDTATGYQGQKPTLALSSRWNGDGTARRCDFKGVFPSIYTDSTTTVTSKLAQAVLTGSFVVPQGIPATDMNEAVAQLLHLLSDPAVVAQIQAGYAAT